MWQRFTERARRAILRAQEEAAQSQSEQVGTAHLLLALAGETDSPAGRFLQARGIFPDSVRRLITPHSPSTAIPGSQPLSPEAKNLLTAAAQAARELQHGDVDSHHLLLALLDPPKSEAAKILGQLQHEPQVLRTRFLEQLSQLPPTASPNPGQSPAAVTATSPLWARFTERVRRVILLAREEALRMHTGVVGPQHLLLGLLHEHEGAAAQALTQMGIELEAVRRAVEMEERPPQKTEKAENTDGEPELSSKARRALELAAEEAGELRHKHIGTEHLLLALLHRDCGLPPLLKSLNLNPADLRRRVLEYLGN